MIDGLISGIATTAEISLSEKLKDYLLRLGYSGAHLTGIVTQLFTKNKVRVDFREFTERIELIDPADRLSSAQAMILLNDFIVEVDQYANSEASKKNTTAKIIVHPPRSKSKNA